MVVCSVRDFVYFSLHPALDGAKKLPDILKGVSTSHATAADYTFTALPRAHFRLTWKATGNKKGRGLPASETASITLLQGKGIRGLSTASSLGEVAYIPPTRGTGYESWPATVAAREAITRAAAIPTSRGGASTSVTTPSAPAALLPAPSLVPRSASKTSSPPLQGAALPAFPVASFTKPSPATGTAGTEALAGKVGFLGDVG